MLKVIHNLFILYKLWDRWEGYSWGTMKLSCYKHTWDYALSYGTYHSFIIGCFKGSLLFKVVFLIFFLNVLNVFVLLLTNITIRHNKGHRNKEQKFIQPAFTKKFK